MAAPDGRVPELWIAAVIVVLDQAAKALVRAKLSLHESVTVIPGFFDLTHVRNTGAAFGMLNDLEFAYKPLVMVLVAVVALTAVATYAMALPPSQRVARFGLALILGGAIGNLIDRAMTGFVVDFVDLYWRGIHFWAFNVADSAITVGVALMLLDMLGVGRVPRLFEIPEIFGVGPLTIYTYGVMLAAAYLLGLQLAIARSRKAGLDSGRMLDLGVYIVIAALVGAKLLLLLVNFNYFRNNPNEILVLARSGGVFYGGLITATLVAFWYIRRHKLPFWTTCDMFAPGIALGHVIGRLGCLMAGCCYGKPTSARWAVTFTDPFAAANVGTPLNVPLHPTQIYEAGAELIILIFLLVTERKGRPYPGRTFWGYMFLYAVSRFVIEFYRADERGFIMGLSTSQFISVILAPLSLIMLVYLSRRFTPEPAKAVRRAA